ncbi:MAG TPA: hypothetical protein VGG48_09420 [Rhizomicrobium sp.]|jgi:hypothetical protein
MENTTSPIQSPQADLDGRGKVIPTPDARQGAISGRVVTVLIVSVAIVAAIFAIMWLSHAQLG